MMRWRGVREEHLRLGVADRFRLLQPCRKWTKAGRLGLLCTERPHSSVLVALRHVMLGLQWVSHRDVLTSKRPASHLALLPTSFSLPLNPPGRERRLHVMSKILFILTTGASSWKVLRDRVVRMCNDSLALHLGCGHGQRTVRSNHVPVPFWTVRPTCAAFKCVSIRDRRCPAMEREISKRPTKSSTHRAISLTCQQVAVYALK